MGVARGYGKLLLFGEHAAVYGHPAVGIRLDGYLEVAIHPRETPGWQVPAVPPRDAGLIRDALISLPGAPQGGRLELAGTLPTSVGFGSSAAFCTALLQAHQPDRVWTRRELWQEAHELERIFHGTPSGIDTGLSVHPGASIIRPDPPGLPSRDPLRLPDSVLLVGAVPRTSSTADLVAGIRRMREHDEASVDRTLHRLGVLAETVGDPRHCESAEQMGRAANEAHGLLASMGLSTPELELLLDELREAGALGAKLSGAGGGGAFYGVFGSHAAAELAARSLRRAAQSRAIDLVYLDLMNISG